MPIPFLRRHAENGSDAAASRFSRATSSRRPSLMASIIGYAAIFSARAPWGVGGSSGTSLSVTRSP